MGISFVFTCVQAMWVKREKNNGKYLKGASLKEEEALEPLWSNMKEKLFLRAVNPPQELFSFAYLLLLWMVRCQPTCSWLWKISVKHSLRGYLQNISWLRTVCTYQVTPVCLFISTIWFKAHQGMRWDKSYMVTSPSHSHWVYMIQKKLKRKYKKRLGCLLE